MIVTRFAPSPTGDLHLGHALSALSAFDRAQRDGGRFLLRIEDIDQTRCKASFIEGIYRDLAWLGLRWEEPVRVQSQQGAVYAAALARLRDKGLLYPCFCTRGDIAKSWDEQRAPHESLPMLYPGLCKKLTQVERRKKCDSGLPYAWRLDVAKALKQVGPLVWKDEIRGLRLADPARFGDVVLARKDCMTSYHLCVTVDDALQGVNLVVRGEDLYDVTDIHCLLQALLKLPTPLYRHHRLLCGPDCRRYAKRDKALTLRSLRENGATPDDIRAMIGKL